MKKKFLLEVAAVRFLRSRNSQEAVTWHERDALVWHETAIFSVH